MTNLDERMFFALCIFLENYTSAEYNYHNECYNAGGYFTSELKSILNDMPTKHNADTVNIINILYGLGGEQCKELFDDGEKLFEFMVEESVYLTDEYDCPNILECLK